MKSYSKLPFQVGNFNPCSVFTSEENGPTLVCITSSVVDARFISHACNSHNDMLAAMQKALEEASNANAQLFSMSCDNDASFAIRDAKEASNLLILLQRNLLRAIAAFKNP